MAIPVPACGEMTLPWRQQFRHGTKADRMLHEIAVCIPGNLAGTTLAIPPEVSQLVRTAQFEAIRFDQESVSRGLGIQALLVQTESIASSRIEEIESDSVSYLRATIGQKVSSESVAMAAGLEALKHVISHTYAQQDVSWDVLLEAHRKLMAADETEYRYAGVIRDVQNWIGGSQFSPRNADYVPPAPQLLPGAMTDLLTFIHHAQCDPLVTAALAHAQFETLHPFTDGNGRIGRALVSAILKSQGITTESVIPLASAFLGARDKYITALTAYRNGDAEPIVTLTARAVLCAAQAGREYLPELEGILASWRHQAEARVDSAAMRLLPLLLRADTINVSSAASHLGISVPAATEGISVLEKQGILKEISGRSRDRYWIAPDVIDMWSEYSANVTERFASLAH